jgi:hypothetical protein
VGIVGLGEAGGAMGFLGTWSKDTFGVGGDWDGVVSIGVVGLLGCDLEVSFNRMMLDLDIDGKPGYGSIVEDSNVCY